MPDRVVNADAQVMRVAADENADLFWALRGGGGELWRSDVLGTGVAPHRHDRPRRCHFLPRRPGCTGTCWWRDAISDAPDELTTTLNLMGAVKPLPLLPEAVHGSRVAVVAACYAGDLDTGEAAVADLRRLGDPITDLVAPCPT